MNMASADSRKSWSVNLEERPAALEITLLKRTYVLPWNQFLYAEGGNDEVRAVFAMHDVVIRGSGLDELLADMANTDNCCASFLLWHLGHSAFLLP